jgi:LPXTG-motif cell wall-anchored protein
VLAAAALSLTTATAAAEPTESPSATPTPPATETSTPAESTAPELPADAPADAPTVASAEDIAAAATFDKPSYATGEEMHIALSLTNNGSAPATISVNFSIVAPDTINPRSDDPLGQGAQVTIAPGATRTAQLVGSVGDPALTSARLAGYVVDGTGAANPFEFAVPVTPTFGHAAGIVFYDEDGDGRYDGGEAQGGVTLEWQHADHQPTRLTVTTDSAGEFAIDSLPAGRYYVSGTAPDGLLVGFRFVTVPASGVDDLRIRAVRPLLDLTVGMAFTKSSYAPAEAPTVRVTLKNDGDVPMTGVIANCNRSGEGPGLKGRSDSWGDLAADRDGVVIAPHATMVVDATEPMPDSAYDFGYVRADCDFGYVGVESDTNPRASAKAAVPGKRVDLTGNVTRDGAGLAGVRMVLTTDAHCPTVAETTTTADGRYLFPQVQTGTYELYALAPAGSHIVGQNPQTVYHTAGRTYDVTFEAAAGAGPAPTVPAQPADCAPGGGQPTTPAPQGSPAPGLASTGASIAVPGLIGLLTLLAGVGAVLITRRRRES